MAVFAASASASSDFVTFVCSSQTTTRISTARLPSKSLSYPTSTYKIDRTPPSSLPFIHDAMNGTPRLRAGAFPSTPQTIPGQARFTSSNSTPQRPTNKLPSIQKLRNFPPPDPPHEPAISLDYIDAATQRIFVVSFYAILWAYRIYDFYTLLSGGNDDQLWLFLKWVAMDGLFLFAIPSLRIPWLEPSSPALVVMFLAHVVIDGVMMFRISVASTI
jgi:nucleoporin POM152